MEKNQKAVSGFVNGKINSIIGREESYIRAALAKLRRGIGKHPGKVPDIWDYTMDNLSVAFISHDDEPTPTQWATHISLTLFAFHQQGKDIKQDPMSKHGASLGSAVWKLVSESGAESQDAIKRRFDTVVTSNSIEELVHHLRGLISIMKSKSVPLDYPQLADDLLKFQSSEQRDMVRLRWGQDYYFTKGKDEGNDDE